ncbi:MAG: hypothetical protein CFE25_00220 [Chitinophagaceae bacterium BSSC1]|nr:MAG: hypothetical protein CFE25_00220 [Chitinophagaceae bacterium BSSC1]
MANFSKIAIMNKSLLTVLAIGLWASVQSQSISRPTSVFEESYGQDGKPMTGKVKLVEGSPMFQEKWFEGKVVLTKGKEFTDAQFQFNLATQQLFFKKDSTVFAFTEPLVSFTLQQQQKGVAQSFQFKNGYPAIGKWGSNCIYQVLVDGAKLQLLKLEEKKEQEQYVYNQPAKWVYKSQVSWYAFLPATREIREVKNNLAELTKILPEFEAGIQGFAANKKGKKLDEPTLSLLFESLNK